MICLDLVHAENGLQLDGFTGEMGRDGVLPKKDGSKENEKIVDRSSEKEEEPDLD
jgi:hypothetical protein